MCLNDSYSEVQIGIQ